MDIRYVITLVVSVNRLHSRGSVPASWCPIPSGGRRSGRRRERRWLLSSGSWGSRSGGRARLEMELGYRYFSLPGSESFSSPGPSTETEGREAGYESDEIRASEEKREG
jgi:hypothetical protein